MTEEVRQDNLTLKKTDDHEAMRRLALASGLEDGTFDDVVASYGYYIGEDLVGCAALKRDGERYAVDWLAVSDGLRSKGLGALLVEKVEAEARMRGADRLWALARAPRFFERIGFKVVTSEESGAPVMSNCLLCSQYQRSCFPAVVMKYL